jgi:hypothetical protein
MAHIRVERTTDSHDCETCGCSFADGARIYVDGELKADLVPSAYCFDGTSYEDEDIDREILKLLGLNLVYSSDPEAGRRLIESLGHEVEIA